MKLTPTFLTFSLGAYTVFAALKPAPKILLSQVDFLTLRNDQMTKSRRVEPIPQVTYLFSPATYLCMLQDG